MKPGYLFPLAALLLAALLLAAYLESGVSVPILQPAGPVAAEELRVMLVTLSLSGIIVVPVFVLLFYFAWRYRDQHPEAQQRHDPNWDHDDLAAEFSWWLVPGIIIAILAVIAWQSSNALDPYKPLKSDVPPLEVEVVALEWKWLFLYPRQGIASVQLLEIPAGTPVHFTLTADAPMNSFWIPQLGGQIMVMPGMTTQLYLMASRTGDFAGYSANISGRGFSSMAFTARAVPPEEFAAWVARVKAASTTPLFWYDYKTLAAPGENAAPRAYSSFAPALYLDIISSYGDMSGMDMQQQ